MTRRSFFGSIASAGAALFLAPVRPLVQKSVPSRDSNINVTRQGVGRYTVTMIKDQPYLQEPSLKLLIRMMEREYPHGVR